MQPAAFLRNFHGILQSDRNKRYDKLGEGMSMRLALPTFVGALLRRPGSRRKIRRRWRSLITLAGFTPWKKRRGRRTWDRLTVVACEESRISWRQIRIHRSPAAD
jgi:hypothetical protein